MASPYWILAAGSSGSWATGANWSTGSVPGTGDNVRIPANTGSINAGLDQSAVTLGSVAVDTGYAGNIGSESLGYLQLACTKFTFAATGGTAFVNLGSSAIEANIVSTGSPASGKRGLYLKGSALTRVSVLGGSVGIAALHGDTATVATMRTHGSSASVLLGAGVTLTTLEHLLGTLIARCAVPTGKVWGGTVTLEEAAASGTAITIEGGTLVHNSTGTLALVTHNGGTLDLTQCGLARTITQYTEGRPGPLTLKDHPAVTIGTWTPYRTSPTNRTVGALAT